MGEEEKDNELEELFATFDKQFAECEQKFSEIEQNLKTLHAEQPEPAEPQPDKTE